MTKHSKEYWEGWTDGQRNVLDAMPQDTQEKHESFCVAPFGDRCDCKSQDTQEGCRCNCAQRPHAPDCYIFHCLHVAQKKCHCGDCCPSQDVCCGEKLTE